MRKSILLMALATVLGSAAAQAETCPQGKVCAPTATQTPAPVKAQSQAQQAAHPAAKKEEKAKVAHHSEPAKAKPHHEKAKAKPHHAPGMYVVAAKDLNVRVKPMPKAPVVGALHHGEKVKVEEIVNGWAKIIYRGKVSWISASFLHHAK
ncbi:SH3 domain-containing protein [Vibrio porteresiae]|nr:SH3 domain-containing protein [Vibrio porteresiae]